MTQPNNALNQTSTGSLHDDLVYAAGFFDGEGCVNITKIKAAKQDSYTLQVSVTNTYLPILDWFQERFGGKIYAASNNRSNLTEYPRSCAALWWNGRAAGVLLRDLEPYIKVKRKQLLNALDFMAIKAERTGRTMPPDLRARLDRCYRIHKRLSSRANSPGAMLEAQPPDEGQVHCMWCGEVFFESEVADHVMEQHSAPVRLPLGNAETVSK